MHGRGGQGIKTALRVLGTALFLEGYEVQDAPRYGAERRGAPIFAYLRASRRPITERGVIPSPGLIVVADETLMALPAAAVAEGLGGSALLLLCTRGSADLWRERLGLAERLIVLDAEAQRPRAQLGLRSAAAAARLLGCVSRDSLRRAIQEELAPLGAESVAEALAEALPAFDAMAANAGRVLPSPDRDARTWTAPEWVEVPLDDVLAASPAIHASGTTRLIDTGSWRTLRPVLLADHCHRCHWICGSSCPDAVITPDAEGHPVIDLLHCKGCLLCVANCPFHALEAVSEATLPPHEPAPLVSNPGVPNPGVPSPGVPEARVPGPGMPEPLAPTPGVLEPGP